MDGNSSERGRHRHRAHNEKPTTVGNPQWTAPSSDRPQWTPPEQGRPESWFEKQQAPAGAEARWRSVSDLTDTAWRTDGAWHDPDAAWNVAAGPARDAEPSWPEDTTWTAPPAWGGDHPDRTAPAWGGDPGRSRAAAWNAAGEPTDAAWQNSERAGAAWQNSERAGSVALLERPEPAPDEPVARTHAVRHPLRLALFALVLFGLVAGSVAWLSMDKSVRLTVDGEARSISTYASTVGGVLDDADITVGEHDTLAPGREAKISEGSEIVLRRGRRGKRTRARPAPPGLATATTVQEALEQVGYRQDGLFVSANRSTRLPLAGYQLTLRTPKTVTVVADGKKHAITTTAPTVGEAMDEAGVTVDGDDRVSQFAGAPVRAGMIITVTRVDTKSRTTRAVVEYKTVEKTDPTAADGSRTVKTKGVTGLQQVTRVETYVDGKLTSSTVAKVTVLRKPVDEVVVLGPEPPAAQSPPPGSSQPAECADFPTTGGLNWCGLAKCESGLNPSAYNPAGPYYGLYQFDQGTWTANGGAGSPSGKSIAEQTAVAWTLYQARGASPWPVCGRNL
jgi:uncharacterized protein YabE (DUF348 family)